MLPGAVAVLGGLMMILGSDPRGRVSAGGLLALLAGLWFIAGPSVSMLWENGAIGTGVGPGRQRHPRCSSGSATSTGPAP